MLPGHGDKNILTLSTSICGQTVRYNNVLHKIHAEVKPEFTCLSYLFETRKQRKFYGYSYWDRLRFF